MPKVSTLSAELSAFLGNSEISKQKHLPCFELMESKTCNMMMAKFIKISTNLSHIWTAKESTRSPKRK